jgi:hypothetical protein
MFLIQIEIICPALVYFCSYKCGSNANATRWHTEKHRRNMHSIRNTKKISNSFCLTLDITDNVHSFVYMHWNIAFFKVCLRIAVGRFVRRYSNFENFVEAMRW